MPEDCYDRLRTHLEAGLKNIQYSKVIMSLSDLLEAEFFNYYIKSGTPTLFPGRVHSGASTELTSSTQAQDPTWRVISLHPIREIA
jgi:hypothetical protein